MEVVGVDCAPGKRSTVFDGQQFYELNAVELEERLRGLPHDALVCWDAPLTGPQDPARVSSETGTYTQRPIESFFLRKEHQWKAPKGISVTGYAGLSHWTISRALLGLPRVGAFDRTDGLPFELATDDPAPTTGRWVVEIHPALAMWVWLRGPDDEGASVWKYKGKKDSKQGIHPKDNCRALTQKLLHKDVVKQAIAGSIADEQDEHQQIAGDDGRLDALIAYALGRLWVDEDSRVGILGDQQSGALLLPEHQLLRERWALFSQRLTAH